MAGSVANGETIVVVSHVGRDLLQSAAVFKHERLVVWEYVSNGLQYVDPGVSPVVRITLDPKFKKITICDNGRGMSWSDLRNFFVMHGENIDRKQGRPGRGYFGTGKAAAFGIAGCLRVTTDKNGRRSSVQLRRADVEGMSSTDPIPVTTILQEIPTDRPNGTVVEIEDIHLRKIDQGEIIKYIERHIARWPNATVYVNHHLCEYLEPPIAVAHRFRPDEGPLRDALGDALLAVNVSKRPLDDAEQGVAVFSNGVWYETTLAGSERKEFANYLFGDIDVPTLSSDSSPVPPFDLSRSMQLNRSNELVQKLMAFIGFNVESVRRELIDQERRRRSSEESKKLAREASEIAKIINQDFSAYRTRISKAQATATGGTDLYNKIEFSGSESNFVLGGDQPAAKISEMGGPGGDGSNGGDGGGVRHLNPEVQPVDNESADSKGKYVPENPDRKTTRGGFDVKFVNMGDTEKRAKYDRDSRTIFINIDHPQLKAAIGAGGVDDIIFRRLAYEVAFGEYAIAVAYEMVRANYFLEQDEPINEIRETVNRVALASAHLYVANR
jgi:hypothetical protein